MTRRPAILGLLALGAVPAPALAEEGFTCRFDVACTVEGCVGVAQEIEIARSSEGESWVFLSSEDGGIGALALSDTDRRVQSFVFHAPGLESALYTLYPDGRIVASVHNENSATPATTLFGACEEM